MRRSLPRAIRTGLLLAVVLPGCATALRWRASPIEECPGPLVPVSEIEGDFVLEQDVRIVESVEALPAALPMGLRLIVQKRGNELVLIGRAGSLTAFTLVQRDREVSVDRKIPLAMPPINWLRDLHRERFLGLDGPAPRDGRRSGEAHGVRIHERWAEGALLERRFGAEEAPATRIEYASPVRLESRACGYTSRIATVRFAPLGTSRAAQRVRASFPLRVLSSDGTTVNETGTL